MRYLILMLFVAVFLACGNGDNPLAPSDSGGTDNPDDGTVIESPVAGNWSITSATIDGMSLSSPDASGSVVFTNSTYNLSLDILGQPVIREYGNYTYDNSTITIMIELSGEIRTWTYTVSKTTSTLTLSGSRSADEEQLSIQINATL